MQDEEVFQNKRVLFSCCFDIKGRDFVGAGEVASRVKTFLKEANIDPVIIRRIAIATYEAEINIVCYAKKGVLTLTILPELVHINLKDEGAGIPDIELAMKEGYSTATEEIRELGFGAGMGLPNIKKNADTFCITSELDKGTLLEMVFYLNNT
ncbi:MAG: ATP-binding protein [Candidatus Tectomicrobia bacterium]|uniref:ATP-binding protein n=1 Tax=Tectimicrobiota bacterium TaxID=2528274 RepID=A0A933GKY1_UNCTE|nr:ATP-binding protein [Candidatus Tectomicrobia bacterium]